MVFFQDNWLQKVDKNGTLTSIYAKKVDGSPTFCYCTLCLRQFSIKKGYEKIEQHAATDMHKNHLPNIHKQMTLTIQNWSSASSSNVNNSIVSNISNNLDLSKTKSLSDKEQVIDNTQNIQKVKISIHNPKEDSVIAEIYYTLDLVCNKYSENSSKHKKELFSKMFPGTISETISLSPAKVAYLITDALAPYFQKLLLDDMNYDNFVASLQYDETTNNENKKELQIRMIFYSEKDEIVVNRHLITKFIEKATGISLSSELLDALLTNGLTMRKILMIGRDGPRVNDATERLLNEEKKKVHDGKSLLKLGSCYLHIIHNALAKGLDVFDIDIHDVLIKINVWFDRSELRWIQYTKSQKEKKVREVKLKKHNHIRWLTIGDASENGAEQLPALEHYFLEYIPAHEKSAMTKNCYKEIADYLKNPMLKGYLLFVSYVAKIFIKCFILIMQKSEPMIHCIYPQIQKLVMILLSSILKNEVKDEKETFVLSPNLLYTNKIESILKDTSKYLPLQRIECGAEVKEFLKSIPEKDQTFFLFELQKFYKAAVLHIDSKIVNRQMLKYFTCIAPENIKNSDSLRYIVHIAKALPLDGIDYNDLHSEWRMLQLDDDICFNLSENERIDKYWVKIFKLKELNDSRYPNVSRVVKAILSLPHGSADVERGFSLSSLHLTEDRTRMSERKLNARITISDAMKKYNNRADLVPMTKDLINYGQNAHRSYKNYLEEQKKIAEENERLKKLDADQKEKEKKLLEELNKQMKGIETLTKDLEVAKKDYLECVKNTEAMDQIISNSYKNKCSTKIMDQLSNSLRKLKAKEKKARGHLDNLHDLIRDKNQQTLKRVIKEKSTR